jgi:hypothetical protein
MSKKNKDHSNPYKVIEDFFSTAPLEHYRKYISSMLQAAYSEGYWKKSNPGSLLFFQELMEKLMTGTYLFIKPHKNRIPIKKKAILKDSAIRNEIDPVLYYGWHHNSAMWEFFPRYLTKKEFLNPYLAIEKFFKTKDLKTWLKDFKELISHSLSPFGNETGVEFDYLRIHKHLQKLVEAAHLIEARVIRTNHNIGKK